MWCKRWPKHWGGNYQELTTQITNMTCRYVGAVAVIVTCLSLQLACLGYGIAQAYSYSSDPSAAAAIDLLSVVKPSLQTLEVIGHCERHLIRCLLSGDWVLGGDDESTSGVEVTQQELNEMDYVMKDDVMVSGGSSSRKYCTAVITLRSVTVFVIY